MANEKELQRKAHELMESGRVGSAIVQDGKVLVKNENSGEWEPHRGQDLQNPSGNFKKS